ncbi:HVO_0234 family beta-propeller protein [Halomicrococcus gelatinilyticus]|uniref:HVO_0234 family beta-propeller protein n=1 Tax=Halomicrococcus gelatinilyticus TaxID=1702103 RepID=UPI002E10AF10
MVSIDEKRVYGEREGATTVYVAADIGVATVAVSDDIVGEFGITHRCTALDVATRRGGDDAAARLAVATDEDVLDDAFEPLDFGPAVAVGFDGDDLLAASPDGTLARRPAGSEDWRELGSVGEVRAIDGDLVATDEGVDRALDDGVQHAGLDDVRDVAAAETPLAATADGVYRLGNGWMQEYEGDVRVVAADGDRVHAATPGGLFARHDGEWEAESLPAGSAVVDVAYGDGTYAVTADGTLLVTVGDGWRHRSIGLRDVAAIAVP